MPSKGLDSALESLERHNGRDLLIPSPLAASQPIYEILWASRLSLSLCLVSNMLASSGSPGLRLG